MANRTPAEVFPPGDFIAEELEARGWSQIEFADILGRPARLVSELIAGKRAITPETARGLGAAFGTGPEFWMNLERDYQLSRAVHDDMAVQRFPGDRLGSFLARKHPFYYERDVVAFAKLLNRHPGLIVGQMQFRLNNYSYLTKYLVKVRSIVLPGAIADGWGQTPSLQFTN